MTYHVKIQTERRSPVTKTVRTYVGRVEYALRTDEDGETYQEQIWLDENNPSAWEDREVIGEDRRSPFTDTGTIHCLGDRIDNLEDENILMVVEWDGSAPYVILHKGDYSATDLRFAGWPELTKEELDVQNPPA